MVKNYLIRRRSYSLAEHYLAQILRRRLLFKRLAKVEAAKKIFFFKSNYFDSEYLAFKNLLCVFKRQNGFNRIKPIYEHVHYWLACFALLATLAKRFRRKTRQIELWTQLCVNQKYSQNKWKKIANSTKHFLVMFSITFLPKKLVWKYYYFSLYISALSTKISFINFCYVYVFFSLK